MKKLGILTLLIYGGLHLVPQPIPQSSRSMASQSDTQVKCTYRAPDIPKPIVGFGSTLNEARANASSQCFEVRMNTYEARNPNEDYDMDRGYEVTNHCTNISCS